MQLLVVKGGNDGLSMLGVSKVGRRCTVRVIGLGRLDTLVPVNCTRAKWEGKGKGNEGVLKSFETPVPTTLVCVPFWFEGSEPDLTRRTGGTQQA